ncbi:2-hydroxymuconate tautomerase [Jeotgalibacillus sp. JSM ZJ347]|uniref:2-hydroxymuconate tautomerase n=1 Tax=Jeotgalibacillus sp. JSM ZJ347 TaxID=3342117 RepID=UPI0035A87BD3
MPIVTVKMIEGRSDDQKRALVKKVTDAVVETTGATPDKVSIIIEEMKKTDYGVGGTRVSDQ